jgi:transcription termination/antitermination protein NusG
MSETMDKKWYIIHTATGSEQTAKSAIEERIRSHKMEKFFGDILIPAESVVELVKGQKKEKSRVTQAMAGMGEKPRPKVKFSVGENVMVVDGPFSNFNGTVEEINEDKAKVKVLVSIFGRPTPVELDFVQVEKS